MNLNALKEKIDGLESQLSRVSSAYAEGQEYKKANLESVREALPENAVLIEFSQNIIFPLEKDKEGSDRYTAFVQLKFGGSSFSSSL